MRSRRLVREEQRLVEETEAFLAGHYLDLLLERRVLVPVWAWLNPVAHLGDAELSALASPVRGVLPPPWDLPSFLAGEVLAAAHRLDVRPAWLQATRLVPLEVTMASPEGAALCRRRWELAPMVSDLLEQARPPA